MTENFVFVYDILWNNRYLRQDNNLCFFQIQISVATQRLKKDKINCTESMEKNTSPSVPMIPLSILRLLNCVSATSISKLYTKVDNFKENIRNQTHTRSKPGRCLHKWIFFRILFRERYNNQIYCTISILCMWIDFSHTEW